MNKTELSKFFDKKQVELLQDFFAIKSMEQLLALKNTSVDLSELAEVIGIKIEIFLEILKEAKKTVRVAHRSNRKYAFGAYDGISS